jgi:hypothetical protein
MLSKTTRTLRPITLVSDGIAKAEARALAQKVEQFEEASALVGMQVLAYHTTTYIYIYIFSCCYIVSAYNSQSRSCCILFLAL